MMEVIFVKYINMNSHRVKLHPVQAPETPSARNPQQWAGDAAEGNCCNLMRR